MTHRRVPDQVYHGSDIHHKVSKTEDAFEIDATLIGPIASSTDERTVYTTISNDYSVLAEDGEFAVVLDVYERYTMTETDVTKRWLRSDIKETYEEDYRRRIIGTAGTGDEPADALEAARENLIERMDEKIDDEQREDEVINAFEDALDDLGTTALEPRVRTLREHDEP